MIGLQSLAIPSCPPAKRPLFSLDLPAVIVVFIDILPNWSLFGIIKQIYHASVGILMECLPSGGWFSFGLHPRGNHPSSGRHSIRIPTLAWHICIMKQFLGSNQTLTKTWQPTLTKLTSTFFYLLFLFISNKFFTRGEFTLNYGMPFAHLFQEMRRRTKTAAEYQAGEKGNQE